MKIIIWIKIQKRGGAQNLENLAIVVISKSKYRNSKLFKS